MGMTKMISILATSLFAAAFTWSADGQNSNAIPAGIEKLHKDDITATIARTRRRKVPSSKQPKACVPSCFVL